MKSLRSYISKSLVSIEEGERVGYVLDCVLDDGLKKLEGFVIVDDESEEEKFLPARKIRSENEEFLFVLNSFEVEFLTSETSNNPVGKRVFDEKGNDYGKVEDVILSDSFKLEKLVTNRCEINQKNIITNGKDFLFFGNKRKINIKNQNYFEKNKKNNQIIENYPKIKIQEKLQEEVTSPQKIYSSAKSLLNRIATCDVLGLNNELIIKKFGVIDQNVINKAKKHNKLSFLMFNSK